MQYSDGCGTLVAKWFQITVIFLKFGGGGGGRGGELLRNIQNLNKEDKTVKEAHAPPPAPPFGSKIYIIVAKAHRMLIKWDSFADGSFKFK